MAIYKYIYSRMPTFAFMVNLEWYRTFKAIYQNGNLTRAAEELFISQPNVSIQLASLESYIGHKLFQRLPRKLVPTEYGNLLYTQIVDSIENLERVESEFRKVALNRIQNIRIGSPIEYGYNILLSKLGSCTANVNLSFGLAEELLSELENKELDFVIATQKTKNENFVYESLIEEEFMIVSSATHDNIDFENHIENGNFDLAEKWLLEQNWISYDSKLSVIRRFWKENFNKRPLLKPRYIIPDMNMIIKSVSLGYGISIVSDLLIESQLVGQNMKIVWKGENTACNQLWLAYNPLLVEEEQIEEMRKILGVK